MNLPLVSVICVCYNHARYVEEALRSVFNQNYAHIEIIIVDDASTDNSCEKINALITTHQDVLFIKHKTNVGLCKSFNEALRLSKGEFVIDFSTDDVMEPDKIRLQIAHFLTLTHDYGVVFTDALYIDTTGAPRHRHFENLLRKKIIDAVPQGDVYTALLSTYIVAAPTMMVRRSVYEVLNGYDEQLSFEDFDFWVRSSRLFKYSFLNLCLMRIRETPKSMSTYIGQATDQQLHDTFRVCVKAKKLNRTDEEDKALIKRLQYHVRQTSWLGRKNEAQLFYNMLREMKGVRIYERVLFLLKKLMV